MGICSVSYVGRWEVWKYFIAEAHEVIEAEDAGFADFTVHRRDAW